MSELESIEKLVEAYKPRIENIFGKRIGYVTVQKCSFLDRIFLRYEMVAENHTLYVNQKLLKKAKRKYPETEKRITVHELTHILDNNNKLSPFIYDGKYRTYMDEGFAEFVAHEFPEIYQDEKVIDCLKENHKREIESFQKEADQWVKERKSPYYKGYEFFKKVGEKIGKKNVLKVFQNPPQSMEEILQPEKYLERIGANSGETN